MDYLWITKGLPVIYISFYIKKDATEIRTKGGGNRN